MKHIIFFFIFLNFFTLNACSLNTKLDDADYRPVGASEPFNSKTHTVSETPRLTSEQPAEDHTESVSTRYIQPGDDEINAFEMGSPTSKNSPVKETTPSITQNKNKEDIITRTINSVFNSRYGDSNLIIKIAKTVHIHCEQSQDKLLTADKLHDNSHITICEYQFPEYCGAHHFSLITNNNKQLLMFHDNNYQRNIIDTLSGNQQSVPGLWDKDDYVSSDLLTVSQLINNNTINTGDLGWIMAVSDNEKSQLGRSYFAAINETGKCF